MNPLQNPTYQKLRDLILASEGRTLEDELGFGCYVNWNWIGKIFRLFTGIERREVGEVVWVINHRGEEQSLLVKTLIEKGLILGRSISLARVLRALGDEWTLNSRGELWNRCFCCGQCNDIAATFDIDSPLHLQAPETWEKLLEVLESNQK